MPRLLLLATCALAACSASSGARTSAPVEHDVPISNTARARHALVDLTGTWATGSEGEPAARRLEVRPQCNSSPATWILEQAGDSLRAWVMPASQAQGIASTHAVSSAGVLGKVSGVDVTIGTAGMRYLLRYDSTSGHLRGTLNGAPFWAVRQDIVRPEGCIGVP